MRLMRITGGKARSISLDCPTGDWVRPATDRMREAVFSSIGADVEGATFLDLFAGAGTYGLESISRGAASGVFVEQHRSAVKAIAQNLQMVLKSIGSTEDQRFAIQSMDVFKWLASTPSHQHSDGFDLVFVDPPYKDVEGSFLRLLMALIPLLNQQTGAWIIFESPVELTTFPVGYERKKTFGKGREDTRGMLLSWLPNR